jgi:hypothetical protein
MRSPLVFAHKDMKMTETTHDSGYESLTAPAVPMWIVLANPCPDYGAPGDAEGNLITTVACEVHPVVALAVVVHRSLESRDGRKPVVGSAWRTVEPLLVYEDGHNSGGDVIRLSDLKSFQRDDHRHLLVSRFWHDPAQDQEWLKRAVSLLRDYFDKLPSRPELIPPSPEMLMRPYTYEYDRED